MPTYPICATTDGVRLRCTFRSKLLVTEGRKFLSTANRLMVPVPANASLRFGKIGVPTGLPVDPPLGMIETTAFAATTGSVPAGLSCTPKELQRMPTRAQTRPRSRSKSVCAAIGND